MARVGCAAIGTLTIGASGFFSRNPDPQTPFSCRNSLLSLFPNGKLVCSPFRNPKCVDYIARSACCIRTEATSARFSNFQEVLFEPLVSEQSTQVSKSSPIYSALSALIGGSKQLIAQARLTLTTIDYHSKARGETSRELK